MCCVSTHRRTILEPSNALETHLDFDADSRPAGDRRLSSRVWNHGRWNPANGSDRGDAVASNSVVSNVGGYFGVRMDRVLLV